VLLKYRGRSEITSQILESAKDGKLKTKIMYEVELSFTQVNDYFTMLETNGLLEKKSGLYKTTSKGLQYLISAAQIDKMFDPTKKTK
jgi:predicted transcriptional regulator